MVTARRAQAFLAVAATSALWASVAVQVTPAQAGTGVRPAPNELYVGGLTNLTPPRVITDHARIEGEVTVDPGTWSDMTDIKFSASWYVVGNDYFMSRGPLTTTLYHGLTDKKVGVYVYAWRENEKDLISDGVAIATEKVVEPAITSITASVASRPKADRPFTLVATPASPIGCWGNRVEVSLKHQFLGGTDIRKDACGPVKVRLSGLPKGKHTLRVNFSGWDADNDDSGPDSAPSSTTLTVRVLRR